MVLRTKEHFQWGVTIKKFKTTYTRTESPDRCIYIKEIGKGIIELGISIRIAFVKWTVSSYGSCLVIIIISIWYVFLILNLLVCRYFDPFTIGSPGKYNKQHLHSRHLASYLIYGFAGLVRKQQGDMAIRNRSTHRGASGRDNNNI
jgi:hypothetical protein